ncbi:MAG: DNA polymerase III subunit delta' [Planctomycetaceae bacterium]
MPSTWDDYRGHREQIAMFRRAIERGRLSQAYLFVGPAGVGKRLFARKLSSCLFCERHDESELDACGECPSCRQMAAGSHPDHFEIGCPEGKRELPLSAFIGERDERGRAGLCYQLSLRPSAGIRRIAVIDDADTMNDEAANAFLKTLEEPQPGAVLILIAPQAEALLPTIRSRCQLVRFAPLTAADVTELLLANEETDDRATAETAAGICDGSLEVAAQLIDPALQSLRSIFVEELGRQPFSPAKAAERIVKAVEPIGDLAAQREATCWLARFAASHFRETARSMFSSAGSDRAAASFGERLLKATGDPAEAIECLAGLTERAEKVEGQIALYTSPVLCIEAFTYDVANRLRR